MEVDTAPEAESTAVAAETTTKDDDDGWFYFDTKFDLSHQENRLFSPKCAPSRGDVCAQ